MVSTPLFEDLYVVSDLHMGGTMGAPIFNQKTELASLINHLTDLSLPEGGRRALVLNGDVFDTLAEPLQNDPDAMGQKKYMAGAKFAEELVIKIIEHPNFASVWTALGAYIAVDKNSIVFNIGNHDCELIYPNVQEVIARNLQNTAVKLYAGMNQASSKNKEETDARINSIRGRIVFSSSGIGWQCRVGKTMAESALIHCFHGNEYDDWNAIDPEFCNRQARAACLGVTSPISETPPNAGTEMVIDVMNSIKARHPFVDLLKPEKETVFNILLALDPKAIKALPGFLKSLSKAETIGARRTAKVLGQGDPTASAYIHEHTWKGEFGKFVTHSDDKDLLARAWEDSAKEMDYSNDYEDDVLGIKDFFINSYRYAVNRIKRDPDEAMRCALLSWVDNDHSWDLNGPDEIFDELLEIQPDIDVAIAGHTHLRRQKQCPRDADDKSSITRSFLYLNTGTWARLIRLERKLLESKEQFGDFWQKLKPEYKTAREGMDALDAMNGIVRNESTVAVVKLDEDKSSVKAAICEYHLSTDQIKPINTDKDENEKWEQVILHG